jgi:sugar (pentulose or hexulose) kinase
MLPSDKQSQKKCVLAIALGSGGPKVALVDQDGGVIASHSVETHIIILSNRDCLEATEKVVMPGATHF